MVAVVGNMAKGTINDHKTKMEVLMEAYSKVITKRNVTFVKNQIAGQLGILLMSKRGHITSFAKVQEILKIMKSLQPTSKAFWFNIKV